ncbi:FixH family protein [Neobacillus mesonae]|uniref:FixH family protein n=1 Tax=Neobacillus mesonae TaxID=1193713 RepID=UPI00203B21BE|nr:FixH family protein [Neobacillus mesonae]MCM3567120.1 FixH family protein [Neobacillus mesonae]
MKGIMAVLLFLAALLTGCSSGPDYTIKLTKELYFQQDKASPIEIKVTGNNKPAKGLTVKAELSMTNMDHGTAKVTLKEGKDGIYAGEAKLPMTGKYEAAFTLEKDGKKTDKIIDLTVEKPKGAAKINGQWITTDDIAFYQFINQLQLEINREAAKKQYSGKQLEEELSYLDSQETLAKDQNQLLTQIIRLRSMALLAEEKGHKASDADVAQELEKVRGQYNQFSSAQKLIKTYCEGKFWAAEKEQYKMIVLSKKVQEDVLAQVKKENPKAGDQEVLYLAQQKYEDLLVSQVNSLKIEIL